MICHDLTGEPALDVVLNARALRHTPMTAQIKAAQLEIEREIHENDIDEHTAESECRSLIAQLDRHKQKTRDAHRARQNRLSFDNFIKNELAPW